MPRYLVYLEISEVGLCMAHVTDLLGCIVRAASREEALYRLPEAIRDYYVWLRRYGEAAPSEDEPVQIEVAGESTGFGPFDPGDAAALFPSDWRPLTLEGMEHHFRLMGHARADLLALVRDLPDSLLEWQPDPQCFPILRLLRHIGNAEKWYVSRLVTPEILPPEWKHDEDLPILEYLEMERRTALARLRQLTAEERCAVFYPAHHTRHPEEPWTARKVLRRFLEHEREHTAQIRAIMAGWRAHLLARLAAERAGLLEQLIRLDEETLTKHIVSDDWTVKDLLAHVAAWDRWELREMQRMLSSEAPDLSAVQDEDAYNAATVAAWRERSVGEVLAELREARAEWVDWLRGLSVEAFCQRRIFQEEDWGFPGCIQVQWQHDAEHAAQIAAWRKAKALGRKIGPKQVLLAALATAREELLSAAALVPAGQRASLLVCGKWTLKDVLGHVADWEQWIVEDLRQMAADRSPRIGYGAEDIEAWNQAHAEARRDQAWDRVWADLHTARQALLEVMDGMSQADLARTFPCPWAAEATPYDWACILKNHDRRHAEDLRAGDVS